jgi:thiamine biosynthesis lipoprotein
MTGYPVQYNLLSASIISTSATKADALATACMSMGTEKAKYLIENEPDIEGFLIYSENNELKSWQSSSFPK